MMPIGPLESAIGLLFRRFRGDDRGVQVQDQLAGEQLASDGEPGEPTGTCHEEVPHVPTDLRTRLGPPGQPDVVDGVEGSPDRVVPPDQPELARVVRPKLRAPPAIPKFGDSFRCISTRGHRTRKADCSPATSSGQHFPVHKYSHGILAR